MPRLLIASIVLASAILVVYGCGSSSSGGADAPDPGGDAAANITLPPTGERWFGFNDDVNERRAGPGALLSRLRRAGANVVRTPLSWNGAEPRRGRWSERFWRRRGRVYETALRHDITPLFVLGFAPPWAREPRFRDCRAPGPRCAFPPALEHVDQWARFTAEAARRFPKAIFELWNEPNLRSFWRSRFDPGLWARLAVAGDRAIERVDPSVKVLLCGCAGIVGEATRALGRDAVDVGEFLARAYAAAPSIKGRGDALAFHVYPQAWQPADPTASGTGSYTAQVFEAVRGALADGGEPGKKLWVDEYGFWTSGPRAVTESVAATGVAGLTRRLLTIDDVEGAVVHRAIDPPPRAPQGRNGFGVMRRRPLLAPKRSWCELAAMTPAGAPGSCDALSGAQGRGER